MQLEVQIHQLASSATASTRRRPQTREEEIANSHSHGLGLAAALVAGGFLIAAVVQRGSLSFSVGVGIYAATMVLLYLGSTLYHGLPVGRAKAVLLVCDHSAIYLFIAGSYTPFGLGVLRGPWGLALLALVWAMALGGIGFKLIAGAHRYPKLSTSLYLAMGWVLLLAAGPIWHLMAPAGVLWLLTGGMAYSIGVAFFRAEGMRYGHFVWHWFVLAGTVCHFVAVLRYAGGA